MGVMRGCITKIVSGGQTGADRAALDWALANRVEHGGWCPKGRLALDGPLHARYLLTQTPSAAYPQRTEWNVRDSDATIVFTMMPTATGGSLKTIKLAGKHQKPCLHFHQGMRDDAIAAFLETHGPRLLNIAGSREEKEAGIYGRVMQVLERTLPPWIARDR